MEAIDHGLEQINMAVQTRELTQARTSAKRQAQKELHEALCQQPFRNCANCTAKLHDMFLQYEVQLITDSMRALEKLHDDLEGIWLHPFKQAKARELKAVEMQTVKNVHNELYNEYQLELSALPAGRDPEFNAPLLKRLV